MKIFFINLAGNVALAIQRFFVSFCFTVSLSVAGIVMVVADPASKSLMYEVLVKLMLVSIFGVVFCAFGKVLYESVKDYSGLKTESWVVDLVLALLSIFSYFAIYDIESAYVGAGYFGIMIALLCGLAFLSAGTRRFSNFFSYIFKNIVFNGLVCGIITAGIFICIGAFYWLILPTQYSSDKAFLVSFILIWGLLFLNLSLSAIPREETELKIPKLFKTLVLYVSLPVFLLLLAILYVYLGKIVVTLSFPSGQINWFVSFAALLFVFFVLALEQYREENKLADLFIKFGGYAMIPILGVQFWAVIIRLSNHGLTSARYVSLALNILVVAFVAVSLIRKGRYLKHMFLALAGAALLLSVTPLNIIDVPVWNQTARLKALLEKYEMIDDGKIVPNKLVSFADQEKIVDIYLFLSRADKKPALLDSIQSDQYGYVNTADFEAAFGFSRSRVTREDTIRKNQYGYYRYDCFAQGMDIESYSTIHAVSGSQNNKGSYWAPSEGSVIFVGDMIISFDLQGAVKNLYLQFGIVFPGYVKLEFPIGDDLLVLESINFVVDDDDNVAVEQYEGFFFVR
ncbi:MAG: DUF4153 domain-containing protein [Peptococcaceae bacterium]|nr:DUF4153 domain-containing protein [Peptococcaceae bacterium]